MCIYSHPGVDKWAGKAAAATQMGYQNGFPSLHRLQDSHKRLQTGLFMWDLESENAATGSSLPLINIEHIQPTVVAST